MAPRREPAMHHAVESRPVSKKPASPKKPGTLSAPRAAQAKGALPNGGAKSDGADDNWSSF